MILNNMAGKPCDCFAVRRMIRDIEEDSLERTGGHVRYVPYLQCLYVLYLLCTYSVCTFCIYTAFALHQIPYRITVQYRTVQCSIVQYSIVYYSIVQYVTV